MCSRLVFLSRDRDTSKSPKRRFFGRIKMMKSFSNNIIFFDTEFSSLNPYKGEILSIGLIKLNGEELYVELEYDGEVDKWVEKNISPSLTKPKISRKIAVQKIKEFVGDSKPYMLAYVGQFDAVYFYKLLEKEKDPFHWIPIDFASILFAAGVNPEEFNKNKNKFCKRLGVDFSKHREHNALDDARLLREVYLKFVENGK